jgi:Spy/CpxP family protein refolding chaperone
MKYRTLFKGLFLALLFTAMTGIAFAQQAPVPPPNPAKNPQKMKPPKALLPDLSDSLNARIDSIRLKNREDVLPVQNRLREKRAHLQTLATAKNVDMEAINQTIADISSLKTQIAKKRIASFENIRHLLNDRQRIMFDSQFDMFFSDKMRPKPPVPGPRPGKR